MRATDHAPRGQTQREADKTPTCPAKPQLVTTYLLHRLFSPQSEGRPPFRERKTASRCSPLRVCHANAPVQARRAHAPDEFSEHLPPAVACNRLLDDAWNEATLPFNTPRLRHAARPRLALTTQPPAMTLAHSSLAPRSGPCPTQATGLTPSGRSPTRVRRYPKSPDGPLLGRLTQLRVSERPRLPCCSPLQKSSNAPVQAWRAHTRRDCTAPPNPPAVACNRLLATVTTSRSKCATLSSKCPPAGRHGIELPQRFYRHDRTRHTQGPRSNRSTQHVRRRTIDLDGPSWHP